MSFQNYLIDAIDIVLSWDISDEAIADDVFSQAVIAQATLMAGAYSD